AFCYVVWTGEQQPAPVPATDHAATDHCHPGQSKSQAVAGTRRSAVSCRRHSSGGVTWPKRQAKKTRTKNRQIKSGAKRAKKARSLTAARSIHGSCCPRAPS